MTIWRTDAVSRTFKFKCATIGIPKKGKRVTIEKSPENLEEMLDMLRGMGYRPKDVIIYDTEFVYEHGNVYI